MDAITLPQTHRRVGNNQNPQISFESSGHETLNGYWQCGEQGTRTKSASLSQHLLMRSDAKIDGVSARLKSKVSRCVYALRKPLRRHAAPLIRSMNISHILLLNSRYHSNRSARVSVAGRMSSLASSVPLESNSRDAVNRVLRGALTVIDSRRAISKVQLDLSWRLIGFRTVRSDISHQSVTPT